MDEQNSPSIDERIDTLARSQELLANQLTGLVELLSNQASQRTEPAQPVDEKELLERKNKDLMAKLERTMSAAGRAGMGSNLRERIETAGGFKGMVVRAQPKLAETSAVAMVCESQASRRDAGIAETPTRQQLESDLRSILAAAYADGIISDPDDASW